MIPQGFGDSIAGFDYTHNETLRDTPYLTIGHTPLSFGGFATSSRGAFAFRGHSASTSATHVTGTVGWRKLFLYLFFSRASTTSRRSATATATATSSAWWGGWRTWAGRSGGSVAHRRSPSPFFVDRGHCIGMRDISNTPASRTLLSIFIQQIHSGHPGTSSRLFGGDSGTSTWGRHRRGGGGGPCACTSTRGEGCVGAVVTGRVLVDVTGHSRLVVVVVVVTGRVRVDVTGRV